MQVTHSYKTEMLPTKYFTRAAALVLIVLLPLLNACTKQVAGPKGEPGAPGGKGNMVLSSSTVFNISSSGWTAVKGDWESLVFLATITDNVIAKGEVRVYVQVENLWYPLPYSEGDIFTQFTIEKGLVRLKCTKIHSDPPQPKPANYRVVVIGS